MRVEFSCFLADSSLFSFLKDVVHYLWHTIRLSPCCHSKFCFTNVFFSDFRLFFLCRPIPRGDCRIYSQSYRISFSPFPRTFQHLSTTTRRKSCIHYTLCVDGVAGVSVYRVFSVKARRLNILKAYVVVRLCAIRP